MALADLAKLPPTPKASLPLASFIVTDKMMSLFTTGISESPAHLECGAVSWGCPWALGPGLLSVVPSSPCVLDFGDASHE